MASHDQSKSVRSSQVVDSLISAERARYKAYHDAMRTEVDAKRCEYAENIADIRAQLTAARRKELAQNAHYRAFREHYEERIIDLISDISRIESETHVEIQPDAQSALAQARAELTTIQKLARVSARTRRQEREEYAILRKQLDEARAKETADYVERRKFLRDDIMYERKYHIDCCKDIREKLETHPSKIHDSVNSHNEFFGDFYEEEFHDTSDDDESFNPKTGKSDFGESVESDEFDEESNLTKCDQTSDDEFVESAADNSKIAETSY